MAQDGSPENPWQVSTPDDLQGIGYEDWSAVCPVVRSGWLMSHHYIQTTDIDLSGYGNFVPIGHASGTGYTNFTGEYDGDGNRILNLTIYKPDDTYVGLFARTSGAVIENLQIMFVNVLGRHVGAVAGFFGSGGSMEDVEVLFGEVTSPVGNYCGGLVGRSYSYLARCVVCVDVSGNSYTGGLSGYDAHSATIERCSSHGKVVSGGTMYVGGLLGGIGVTCTIIDCFATGNIEANAMYVGGLIGRLMPTNATIERCYATGDVQGTRNAVGGILGCAWYAQGSTVTHTYFTGSVRGGQDFAASHIGRIRLGFNENFLGSGNYNNYETSRVTPQYIVLTDQSISLSVLRRTTEQMKDIGTYTAWNIAEADEYVDEDWWIISGKEYPRLGPPPTEWRFAITGIVSREDGEVSIPVEEAKVSLIDDQNGLTVKTTRSFNNGRYYFEFIDPRRTYHLVVEYYDKDTDEYFRDISMPGVEVQESISIPLDYWE